MLSRLLLLLMLYMLQGVPFAMLQQSLPALLARSLSFGDLGILSFAMLPFALKVMLAPAVDILWWKRFGRRRSWVVPCTAATAVLWLVLSLTIEECMAAHATGQLSTALFAIILLLSAQDAAVDAWALELLPAQHVAYASVCQSTGLGLGNLLGHPVLLLVTEPSGVFARWVGEAPLLGFSQCLSALACVHLLVALAALVESRPSPARIIVRIVDSVVQPLLRAPY